MVKRYYTQVGSDPTVHGAFHISGPQAADQIPPEVQLLLDRPGIHTVVVLYNHGLGERLDVIRKMPEEPRP